LAEAGVPVPVHVRRKIASHGTLTTTPRHPHPDRQSIRTAGEALALHLTGEMVPKWSPDEHHMIA
jgi:hypothetical protein